MVGVSASSSSASSLLGLAAGLPRPHRWVHERSCQAQVGSPDGPGEAQAGTEERGPLGSVQARAH